MRRRNFYLLVILLMVAPLTACMTINAGKPVDPAPKCNPRAVQPNCGLNPVHEERAR